MPTPRKSRARKSRLALTGGTVAALIAIPSAIAAASTPSPPGRRQLPGVQADDRHRARRLGRRVKL